MINKQLFWFAALLVWQLLLAVVIYQDWGVSLVQFAWPGIYTPDISIGIGDFQIALAMLLLVAADLRWTLRVPLALVLFLSAFGAHCFAWAIYFYPFVGGNEYLIAVWVAVATATSLWIWQRWRRVCLKRGNSDLSTETRTALQFHFADLLVWIALIGVVLMIARQAFVLTDVSGMIDPWEAIRFLRLHIQFRFAGGLPITIAAIGVQALAWTAVFAIALNSKVKSWHLLGCVPAMLLLLTLVEFAISYCSDVVFDKPPPDVPVSHAPLFVWMMHWNFEGGVRIALVFVSRVVAFSVSLLCLRQAGFQWRPLNAPASEGLSKSR